MKQFSVEIEESAWADLENAYRWILKDSPSAANRWFNGCLAAMRKLSAMPERRVLATESAAFNREIRQLVYGKYRILFTIESSSVHILYVRHSAREFLTPPPE